MCEIAERLRGKTDKRDGERDEKTEGERQTRQERERKEGDREKFSEADGQRHIVYVCVYAVRATERVPAGSCHFPCFTDPSQSVVSFPCIRK